VPGGEITILLTRLAHQNGESRKATYDRLVALLYDDLPRRARHQMGAERDWTGLQPTALVLEAYERLLGYEMEFQNREHFLNVACTAMRRVLINRARRLKTAKRRAFQSSVRSRAMTSFERSSPLLTRYSTLMPRSVLCARSRYAWWSFATSSD
jgi:DNA-directed RNA polymerase specialized sigma24 family protein